MSANIRDLNQAWDLYYHVFRRISRQLPQLTQLELQYVSPKLLMCRDLELAVPGSYTPVGAVNQIGQVEPSLQVKKNTTLSLAYPSRRNISCSRALNINFRAILLDRTGFITRPL